MASKHEQFVPKYRRKISPVNPVGKLTAVRVYGELIKTLSIENRNHEWKRLHDGRRIGYFSGRSRQ